VGQKYRRGAKAASTMDMAKCIPHSFLGLEKRTEMRLVSVKSTAVRGWAG